MKERPDWLTDGVVASMEEVKRKNAELRAKIDEILETPAAWDWLERILTKLKTEGCKITGIEIDKIARDFKLNLTISHGELTMDFKGPPKGSG